MKRISLPYPRRSPLVAASRRSLRRKLMRLAIKLQATFVTVGLMAAAVLFVIGMATDGNLWFVGAVVTAALSVILAAWEVV
jgi:hypothetical protein